MCQTEPKNGFKNVTKSFKKKTTLETKSTKPFENRLSLTPSDLQETCFRMENCQKSLKTGVWTSVKHIKKSCRNKAKMHEKSAPELNKKRCFNTDAENRWVPESDSFLLGFAYWGAFGGPNRFCDEKVGPQRSQTAPQDRKASHKWPQETFDCETKRAPSVKKSSISEPFRIQARRTARSAYNKLPK